MARDYKTGMKARLTVSCISADTLNMYNQILSSSQCSRSTTGGKSIQRQYLNRSLFQSLECFFFQFFFSSDKSSIELERETAFQASIIPESISKQGEKAIILHASTFFLATYPMTTCSGNRSSQPHRDHLLLRAAAHRWLSPHKSRVCGRKGCKRRDCEYEKKWKRGKKLKWELQSQNNTW